MGKFCYQLWIYLCEQRFLKIKGWKICFISIYCACHTFRYFCLLLIFEILLDEIDYARRTSTFTFTYYFYLLGLNVSLDGIKGCIFSNNCNVYIFFCIRKLFSFHPFPPILKNLRYDITLRKHWKVSAISNSIATARYIYIHTYTHETWYNRGRCSFESTWSIERTLLRRYYRRPLYRKSRSEEFVRMLLTRILF